MKMKNMREKMTDNVKGMKFLNAVALKEAVKTVNSACSWVHHQPSMPEDLKKFRKF